MTARASAGRQLAARWRQSPVRLQSLAGVCGLVFVVLSLACRQADVDGPRDIEAAARGISEHVPPTWSLALSADGQLPLGHYWGNRGADYAGPRGRRLLFVGPETRDFCWEGADGAMHRDPLKREALDVWLMPSDYSEAFWFSHGPVGPAEIFSGTYIKVFAMPAAHVVDEHRLQEALKRASGTGCPDSNERPLSWGAWEEDLLKTLAAPVR